MMRIARLLVFSRLLRHWKEPALILAAIAAASCLVVWVIGGYRNLYTEVVHDDDRPMGRYDVILGAEPGGPGMRGRGGGPAGGFRGPLGPGAGTGGFSPREQGGTFAPDGRSETQHVGPGAGTGGVSPRERGGSGGRPGRGEDTAGDRFDPLAPARAGDGSVVLERVPESIPSHLRKRLRGADADGDGVLSRVEEEKLFEEPFPEAGEGSFSPHVQGGTFAPDGRSKSQHVSSEAGTGGTPSGGPRRGGRFGATVAVPEELLAELQRDPLVRSVDRTRSVRAFVYGEKSETEPAEGAAAPQVKTDGAFEETAPEGVDPDLHRRGLAAYRKRMGTPMALGDVFLGTDAAEPPADLEEGRWFGPEEAEAPVAVLDELTSKRLGAGVGDALLVLTKTDESQLKVVGILENKLPGGFYVPLATAERIGGGAAEINGAGITLVSPGSETEFRARWKESAEKAAPGAVLKTKADVRRERAERMGASAAFRFQAASGTILAILASVMIVLAALSIGVEKRRREIGMLRTVGVTRPQIAVSVLAESLLLAVPGWLGGLFAGWLILRLSSGKEFDLNGTMAGFSFLCAVIGSAAAAAAPIATACRVRPLEAVSRAGETPAEGTGPGARRRGMGPALFIAGLALIGSDLVLIYGTGADTARRAAIHSGAGVTALALGVLCVIPALVRLAELAFLPALAKILRFDGTVSARELSAHIKRTTAIAAMLAVGGGLFALMQVWGYSMLGPFLPNAQMPDAFAAFLPAGLTEENAELVRSLPCVKPGEFEPVAVEQAAFAPESVPNGRGGEFANAVLFGMNVDRAYAGPNPLVRLRFLEGVPAEAFAAMRSGRGVVVNDALKIDYGFRLGDTLKLCDPKRNARVLEYPIVGIVSFDGWQWLSKTGGVRRNYGRSGGVVFASEEVVRGDYHISDTGYFWFNLVKGTDYGSLEAALDGIARKNLEETKEVGEEAESDAAPGRGERDRTGNAAYVKLSTRESLRESISRRADGVIWGLSTMPLVTLALMSIALAAVTVNSVHARRRSFGILRAVGVERGKLVRMILAEAVLLAMVAAAASLLFGVIAAAGALKLGQSMFGTADPPLVLPAKGLGLGLGFLAALAIAAAVVPAVRIGRAKVLELLKGE